MRVLVLLLILNNLIRTYSQDCICTTVPCPIVGENDIVMGNGGGENSVMCGLVFHTTR